MLGNRHASHQILKRQDLLAVDDLVQVCQLASCRRASDLDLFVPIRIADLDQEHEPVQLRFRQGIRAFLLDRVLGREHKERLLQGVADATR